MNKKNLNLRTTIWMGLFIFFTIIPSIIFANQTYDLDEFDDLEKKSDNNDVYKQKLNEKQRLIPFDDNLYLLDDDFDFGDEELELLKLELNLDDIEIFREYENFLNAFFENSTLIRRPSSSEKSNPPITNPPIIKQEKTNPSTKNKIEGFTPVDPNSFEKVNPPIIKKEEANPSTKNKIEDLAPEEPLKKVNPPTKTQEKSDTSPTTIKNKITILPRIGFGMNYLSSYNNIGPIIGGSISYGNNNKWGKAGVDLLYILIKQDVNNSVLNQNRKHTMGINGFYERKILKKIVLRGGLSYVKTGEVQSLGLAAGAGLSFPIGKMLIIQPMVEVNFASNENNIVGINFNIGISL